MPRHFAMSDLRQRCLRRVDLEFDLSIATDEANALMSETFGDLYSLVSGAGMRYFETSTTFTTTGVNTLGEPADHMATVDTIERVVNPTTGRLRRLRQLMPQERARWSGLTGYARRWSMVDDQIYLYPTPPAGDQYIIRYVQQPPDLKTYLDTDVVDVVNPYGEAFMTWGTGVKLLAKSRSDVSLCVAERDKAAEKLTEWAAMRAFNDSPRMIVEDDFDDGCPYDGEWRYDR